MPFTYLPTARKKHKKNNITVTLTKQRIKRTKFGILQNRVLWIGSKGVMRALSQGKDPLQ